MKSLLIFLMLCLTFYGSTEQVPQKQQPFSISVTVSSDIVAIDQLITLQVILKYPPDYHPNLDVLKRRLLDYGSFGEPPFTLSHYIRHPLQKNEGYLTQQLDFLLAPQLSGKHFLTPNMVQFDSNEKKDKSVEIPSEILKINVFVPQVAFDPQSMIEPPMALSQELPVNLSQENRRNYLKNPSLANTEAEKNRSILRNKSFPWLPVASGMIILLAIVFMRLLPSNIIKNKAEGKAKKEDEFKICQAFKKTISNCPKNQKEAIVYIFNLDFLIRKYLMNKYDLPAFSLTSSEMIAKTATVKDFPAATKEGINKILKLADQIKFANYSPTTGDCQDIAQEIDISSS